MPFYYKFGLVVATVINLFSIDYSNFNFNSFKVISLIQ